MRELGDGTGEGSAAVDEGRVSTHLDVLTRLRTQFPSTVATWLALMFAICIPYFTLQRFQWGEPVVVPVTPIDDAIAFEPAWVWGYLSIAPLVALAPAMATRPVELRAFGWGLLALIVPSFVCFALFPVPGPRPDGAELPDGGLFGWLVSVDTVYNSLPSLHAGLTAYMCGYLDVVWLGAETARRRWIARLLLGAWACGILYATLATKQHWFWDLPPGIALGWLAVWVASRVMRR